MTTAINRYCFTLQVRADRLDEYRERHRQVWPDMLRALDATGVGLALVGAYMMAGELTSAGWDPEVGFAGYEERMRDYVEANQEIGRLHVQSLSAPDPDAEPAPEPDMEALTRVIERAVGGPALPDYAYAGAPGRS